MRIPVEPDWWKTLFDEIYLVTDARSVCDDALTRKEVDLLCELVPLKPDDPILDLCGGQGRHSIELCRRGYRDCTVFDYSQSLLNVGAQNALKMECHVRFLQGDARNTPLPSASYRHVLILGNSLGYAGDAGDDLQILREAHRLVAGGGWVAVDITDGRAVRAHFNPNAWHEIGEDMVVCREREICGNRICAREMVISKHNGMVRDRTYSMRLYDARTVQAMMSDAGFEQICAHEDFSPYGGAGDVGFMNHRMVIVGRKGG